MKFFLKIEFRFKYTDMIFLPPKTTALLQPIEYGTRNNPDLSSITLNFRQTFKNILDAMECDPNMNVIK